MLFYIILLLKKINIKKNLTLTAGETTEIDLRGPRFPFLPSDLGVSGCKSASEVLITVVLLFLGVEVVFGPSWSLLTAAWDTIFPVGIPLGLEAKVGVCGVILFPDGFFHVQIR